uniref:Uncharacterized protein n=1 Tax=Hucho hucho TaxID=62062 RepID=A0A4W5QZ23_9TELE
MFRLLMKDFKTVLVAIIHPQTLFFTFSLSPQMEGEELHLELANQKRSWPSEETGLCWCLVAVEMELAEVRQEKKEYQKESILDTVALSNQVSALKMGIASRRDPIVCEEVNHLSQQKGSHRL